MKYFQDSVTLEIWAFDDSVIEDNSTGHYILKTPAGIVIPTSDALQPYTPSIPTVAQQVVAAQTAQIIKIQAAALVAQSTALTFTNTGNTTSSFPMDASAQQKYLGAYTRYVVHGVTLPLGFAFYDATGQAVPFTVTDIDNFATAGFGQVESALEKQAALIAQIQAATTVAAVEAVVW